MKYEPLIDVEMADDSFEQVPEPTGSVKQSGTDDEFEKYKDAMLQGDIETLESMRLNNPEDARFNIHLQVIEAQPKQSQTFNQAKSEHEKLLKSIGIDMVPQFKKILDSGNKKKAIEYIKTSVRKDHPLRNSMIRLIDFM